MAVSVTSAEALLLAQRLRETRSERQFAQALAKIRETAGRVSHLTIEARAQARVPCALLGPAGECSVHEFRPIGCRGWTSFDARVCEEAYHAGEAGHSERLDRTALAVASAVTEGLERGLRLRGVDGWQYELHGALLRAIETPGAAERWAAGQDVFAGCARVTSERLRG